ncbi:MAG: AAA-like domain-containing protein [Calothrix sp. MO_192.B10]|nr:AAA-like domain-containing protein [Calothrix sp. MO_192.B10]
MNQKPPVPRLDLAPKLKRPLSLWNPLDYLRLLYWVFYFPQALRWYVDTFGGGYILEKDTFKFIFENTTHTSSHNREKAEGKKHNLFVAIFDATFWRACIILGKLWQLRARNAEFQLLSQGLVLIVPIVLILLTPQLTILNKPEQGTVLFNTVFALGVSLILGIPLAWMLIKIPNIILKITSQLAWNLAWGIAGGVDSQVRWMVKLYVVLSVGAICKALWTGYGIDSSLWYFIALILAILRVDIWILGLVLSIFKPWNRYLQVLNTTPIPFPLLSYKLKKWLRRDWKEGINNTKQLLVYTLQFIPITQAVTQVLAKTPPEQVIDYVAQLTEVPFGLQLVRCASASFVESTASCSDIPGSTTAGFWYLHEKEPAKAEKTFKVVRSLPYGEEIYILAQTLAIFHEAEEITTITAINPPSSSYQRIDKEGLLRPNTWQAIASLHRVIEDTQLIQHSVSRATRAFALNRAQGELTNILNHPETIPEAERGLIIEIAQNWQKALLQVAGEVGEISITKPVRNPYIIGDPVLGERFVGREDVMRQLEELWVTNECLQSLVLYGHRRMGKTSILRNAANSVGSGVKVAYINMLNAGNISQGVGEVLMAICDVIAETVNLPPPGDADLLNLPYRRFERYLKQIVETQLIPSQQGLIIALDEFEKIEELIEAEKIPSDFMGYLRGLVQMYSQIAFAFAGLHTLEEMTADYFQPFFASVIPIHVGFMERAATRQILANPIDIGDIASEDFPLDYTPEALDKIYHLTHGQPYLVQLVGFQLVRRYNDQVFEMGHSRDPIFTVDDVEAVVNPEFFKRGRYYFDGVWSQATQDVAGQQEILRALAPHPQGLSLDELAEVTGINCQGVQDSLGTLERHDVVKENQGRWQIVVELFRRWVLQQ